MFNNLNGITGRGIIGEESTNASYSLTFEGRVVKVNDNLYTFDVYTLQGNYIADVIIPKAGGYVMPKKNDGVVIEVLPISGRCVYKYSVPDIIVEDQSESALPKNNIDSVSDSKLAKQLNNLDNSEVSSELRCKVSANPYNPVLRKKIVENDVKGSRNSRLPKLPEGSTVLFDSSGGSHAHVDDNGDFILAISDQNIIKMLRSSETFLQTFRRMFKEWPGGNIELTDEKEAPEIGHQDIDLEIFPDTNNHKGDRWHFQFGHNTDHNDQNVYGYIRKYTGKTENNKIKEILRSELTLEKDGGSSIERLFNEDSKKRFEKKINWNDNTVSILVNDNSETEKIKLDLNLNTGEITLHTASNINIFSDSEININSSSNTNITVGGATNVTSSGNTTVQSPNIILDGRVIMT